MKLSALVIAVFALLAAVLPAAVVAQEGEGGIPPEVIAAIVEKVSEGCRQEMQEAMENPEAMSDTCKGEIAAAMSSLSNDAATKEMLNAAAAAAPAAVQEGLINPVVGILLFLLIAGGGLVAFCFHVDAQKQAMKKPKKVIKSKKKLKRMQEKERRKNQ